MHNLCVIYIRYSSLKTYRTTTIEKLWPSQISRNLGKMVRYGLIGAIKFSQKRMLQKNVTYPGWQILHIWIRIHNMAYCKNCFNNKKILDTFFKDIMFFGNFCLPNKNPSHLVMQRGWIIHGVFSKLQIVR